MAAPIASFDAASSEGRAAGSTTAVRLAAWLLLLVAGVSVMHLLGRGALAGPPVRPGLWPQWWSEADPLVAVVALLRLLVVGLGWYLLVVTMLALAGHLARATALVRLAEVVTVRAVRDLIAGIVGLALVWPSASPAAGAVSSTSQVPDVRAPIAVQLTSTSADEPPADELPQLRRRGGRIPSERALTEEPVDLDDLRATEGAEGIDVNDGPDVHVVVSGESFWSIAESRLVRAGQPTDDATVAAYWRCLVGANLDRLVVEGEPDLILPGQELIVPPIAASAAEARP
jgi:hypothetical protein